jgi:REP element-mobilizing transposase RayT
VESDTPIASQSVRASVQVSRGLGDEVPYAVLCPDVGRRCRELVRETARAHEIIIHAGSINRDHVHLLLSISPSLSVSRAVLYLEEKKFA